MTDDTSDVRELVISDPAAAQRTVVVNGHRCLVPATIGHREMVELAFPGMPADRNRFATVVYQGGPLHDPSGILSQDRRISVADEERFSVAVADRS